MTNFEKIKQMSVEELASFLGIWNDRTCVTCDNCIMRDICDYPELPCDENALHWLESEAEE